MIILKLLLTIALMFATFLNVMMILMPGIYVQWAMYLCIVCAIMCCAWTCMSILDSKIGKPKRRKPVLPYVCNLYDEETVMYDGFVEPTNDRLDRR